MKMNTFFISNIIISWLFSSSLLSEELNLTGMQALQPVFKHQIERKTDQSAIQVLVKLPQKYKVGQKFPTVYLLDGGITFPLLASYHHYLSFSEELPDIILVGISYGSDDWKKSNSRSHDYTLPSSERDFWGGAESFKAFLKNKLIPLIEKNYPASTNQQYLFGQSLGGQFALFDASSQTPLFNGYIASNPALHRNLAAFIQPAKKTKLHRPLLFVSSGSDDDARFKTPLGKWKKHWDKISLQKHPWVLNYVTLEGQTHLSAAPESFRQGMKWLLK